MLMDDKLSLSTFIKAKRWLLTRLVCLSMVESFLFVAQFYYVGQAVNDLLVDSFRGIYILTALFLLKLGVSWIKQRGIRRAHKTMYDDLVESAIGNRMSGDADIDDLAPNYVIIHSMTDFFRLDLVRSIGAISRLFFVLLALLYLNMSIFIMALVFVLIVFVLHRYMGSRLRHINMDMANEFVRERQFLKSSNKDDYYMHHARMESFENQLLGRISSGNLIIELLAFGFMVAALIILVLDQGEHALGTFFTMLYYVFALSEVMFLLPALYQRYLTVEAFSKKLNTAS